MLESGDNAINTMLLLFSKGNVVEILLLGKNKESVQSLPYSIKLKTVTLLPTGLKREFPSGVNMMLPLR
jgi:hypothetical protein